MAEVTMRPPRMAGTHVGVPRPMGERLGWLREESARASLFGGWRLRAGLAVDAVQARRDPLRPPLPRLVQLEPTQRCNLSCVMCQRTGRGGPAPEMSFETFREILDRDFRHRHVLLLYGQGEPFLHPELFRMIRWERERGNSVIAVTNGTLLDDGRAAALSTSGLDVLRISIDGATPGTYAHVRCGSELRSVLFGVERLRNVLARTRSRTRLAVTFMALQENYHEIPDLVHRAADLGIPLVEIQELPRYAASARVPLSVQAERDPRFAAELDAMLRAARAAAKVRGVELVTARFGAGASRARCLNPWFKTYIRADGTVTPCSHLCFAPEAHLGRLPETRFRSIWHGPQYVELRRATRAREIYFEGCRRT